jgi:hypothetical protein
MVIAAGVVVIGFVVGGRVACVVRCGSGAMYMTVERWFGWEHKKGAVR